MARGSRSSSAICRRDRPIVWAMEQAAAGVGDHLGEAAVVGEHDRDGVGHCFEGGQAFRFAVDGWRAEDVERLEERDFFCAVEFADVFEAAGKGAGSLRVIEVFRGRGGRLRRGNRRRGIRNGGRSPQRRVVRRLRRAGAGLCLRRCGRGSRSTAWTSADRLLRSARPWPSRLLRPCGMTWTLAAIDGQIVGHEIGVVAVDGDERIDLRRSLAQVRSRAWS